MKKETFLSLVLASVLELKGNATPEELAKLDFETLEPIHKERCILGQITGGYNTERAQELSVKSIGVDLEIFNKYKLTDELHKMGNYDWLGSLIGYKEPIIESFTEQIESESIRQILAPFEHFIIFEGANNEELIQFLKGERETFEPRIDAVVEATI